MGKATPPDKAEELREATRAANEVLGDLKRAMRDATQLVKTAFDEQITESIKETNTQLYANLGNFLEAMKRHSDKLQGTLTERWKYIETACIATPDIARTIALRILQDEGGTVKTDSATWHLVQEIHEDDGGSTFAFPGRMAEKTKHDPKMEAAVRKAVEEHRPDMGLLPWSSGQAIERD